MIALRILGLTLIVMQDDGLYDFADDVTPKPPLTGVAHAPTSTPIAYRSPTTFVRPAPAAESSLRDVQIPLYLVGGAVALELIVGLLSQQTVADTGLVLFFHLLFYGTFSAIAVWIAALRRGVRLGPAAWVPVKLTAFAIVPTAVLDFADPVLRWIPFGPLIALGVVCYTLLGVLFDLDESDSWFFLWMVLGINVVGFFIAMKFV